MTLTKSVVAVLATLRSGRRLTTPEIARTSHVQERRVRGALAALRREGLVTQGRRGYWHATDAATAVPQPASPAPTPDEPTLSYCQSWTLESLCLLAAEVPITAADLAEHLKHNVEYTERYLRQLADLGLVRQHEIGGVPAWRPSPDGALLGTAL
ncbi:hypothetical protein ACIGO9_31370 [Nocardia asteroides]|uniref:hypothetical protein n=1 Tax=Nocardia asteroides TaxID=1824 RepID=UPI0037C6BECF